MVERLRKGSRGRLRVWRSFERQKLVTMMTIKSRGIAIARKVLCKTTKPMLRPVGLEELRQKMAIMIGERPRMSPKIRRKVARAWMVRRRLSGLG